MRKRIIAVLLAVAMILPNVPVMTHAAEQAATLTVESSYANPGSTVNVNIDIAGNPGILGATLTATWDEGLTLVNSANGAAFSDLTYLAPSRYTNGCNFVWYGSSLKKVIDGTILKLTFEVSEEATDADFYNIEITYDSRDILDQDYNTVALDITNGGVRAITYMPGDVSGDKRINPLDLIKLSQYISDGCTTNPDGFNVTINESAADVNDDDRMNPLDLILISRYISDGCKTDPNGYNVELKPHTPRCKHEMVKTPAKEATCEEDGNYAYWYCTICEEYFSNEAGTTRIDAANTVIEKTGHTEVSVTGYPATPEKEGLTDGVQCSVCDKWIVEQVEIPKLQAKEHSITYILASGDYINSGAAYLMDQIIENPNLPTYSENEAMTLVPLSSPGYTFDGWVDQTGTRWDVIPKGTTKDLVLYAKWKQDVYTITFDTPDVAVYYTYQGETLKNSAKYTVDTGLTLTNPEAYKYTFVGWSNDDGFVVDRIEPGTTGNMTLRANWTSDRNRATSYAKYGDPIIIEDYDRKQFLFVYDIGKIDNVPLYNYLKADGKPVQYSNTTVNFSNTTTLKAEFGHENAENVAKTVANATTRSSGWTLSEGWNDVISEGTNDTTKNVRTDERTDKTGNTIGGNYFVSNSEGGSSYSSVESGASSSSSSKITTEDSYGINTTYDTSTEKYCDAELKTGFKNETEVSAGISLPVKCIDVSAGVKNTTTITADATLSSGRKDNEAYHVDTNSSSFVGTDFSSSNSAYYNAVTSNSTNWNSTTSYNKSTEMSTESEVAQAISDEISKTTTYNISKSLNAAETNTSSVSGMTSSEDGYSNSVTVSEYYTKEEVYVESHTDDNVGYHRLVEAGIVHVYAVVGYDIATASYYTYTFNVLEDETYPYWDYSIKDPAFKDCENGLVTFEVPYEVNEYIAGVTGKTDGLEITIADNGHGHVADFEIPENFSGDVVVPQYLGADNLDSTNEAVIVTSFDENAFKGNENIKTIVLPMYVTEIPDNAFEGCTNLETVISYGVTKIGKNAFKGCKNLGKVVKEDGTVEFSAFMIDNFITDLGEDAFTDVNEIKVMAHKSAVADAAIGSGAKKITVDLTKLVDDYNGTKKINNTTDYFGLIGGGKTFNGLYVVSDAKETFISNLTLAQNTDIPLQISSEAVTLARLNVENAPGIALVLSAEDTALKLYRNIKLTSDGKNSILTKNVTLSKASQSWSGSLDFDGYLLTSGTISNTGMLTNTDNIKQIPGEFDKYLTTVTVTFNSMDGSDVDSQTVRYETNIKTPDEPTKFGYAFLGWYKDEAFEEIFNFEEAVTEDITLYAKWKLIEFDVTFDANGGSVDETVRQVLCGTEIGELPIPTRTGYDFVGWFTADNTQIFDDSVMTDAVDITLYAKWTLQSFNLNFDANGGSVDETMRTIFYGTAIGELPLPTRTGYNFEGWFTSDGEQVTADKTFTAVNDITLTANWSAMAYTVNWNAGTGYSVSVERTSSPYANAETGALNAGDTIYYGDILSVTYIPSEGYSITENGATDITVVGNIKASDIYASATVNSYTYDIVYVSSNGTDLGTSTATYDFGTTNMIEAPEKAGYVTPEAQSVDWDSASGKTITFTYVPAETTNELIQGNVLNAKPHIAYSTVMAYRNRTATSVEVSIQTTVQIQNEWNNYPYGIGLRATCGDVVRSYTVAPWGSLNASLNYSSNNSGWMTIPLSTTDATTATFDIYMYQFNYSGSDITSPEFGHMTGAWTVNIPAY